MRLEVRNQPFTYLPDLQLSYTGGITRPFTDDFSHNHAVELSSYLNLSDVKVFENRIQRMEYERMLLEYELLSQQLLYETLELYVDVLKKQFALTLAETSETASKLNYEYALSKNRQGSISDIELLNAEADYDNSIYVSRKSRLDYDIALSSLRKKLGDRELGAVEEPEKRFAYIGFEDIEEKAPLSGEVSSLSIKTGEKELAILKMKKVLAERNRWLPSLNLGLSLTYDRYDYNSTIERWVGREPKLDTSLSFTATFHLFSQNRLRINAEKSELAIQKALIELESARTNVTDDLAEIVDLHNRSVDLLNISKKRVASAQKEYDKKQESFNLGLIPVLDLYETRDRYLEKEKESKFFGLDIILLRARIGLLLGETFLFLEIDTTET